MTRVLPVPEASGEAQSSAAPAMTRSVPVLAQEVTISPVSPGQDRAPRSAESKMTRQVEKGKQAEIRADGTISITQKMPSASLLEDSQLTRKVPSAQQASTAAATGKDSTPRLTRQQGQAKAAEAAVPQEASVPAEVKPAPAEVKLTRSVAKAS